MDRLSGLPDSLIHHILSFLCMKDVVRTTILSKHWKDLWTTVPCLEFTADWSISGESDEVDKFRDFVNRTMLLWRGSKIQKFTVSSMLSPNESFYHDENVWVRLAVRHKVEELDLYHFLKGTGLCLPQCLFTSSSIRELRLSHCDIVFHGKIHWDQLKSLTINNFDVDQLVINNILLGSPQLEFLDLCCGQNVNICSASLKELLLHYDAEDYYSHTSDEIDSELRIWTPNLKVLRISGSVCNEFLVVFVPSLIEAILTFYCPTFKVVESLSDYEFEGDMLRVIFEGIDHVEKLVVGGWFVKVLTVMEKKALPAPLLNLKCLTVDTDFGNECLPGLVNLLEILPNVATLTVRNYQSYSESDDDDDGGDGNDDDDDDGGDDDDDDNDDNDNHADDEDEVGSDNEEQLVDEWMCRIEYPVPEVELSDSFLMNLRILKLEFHTYAPVFSLAKFVLKSAGALEKIVVEGNVLLGVMQKLLRMPEYPTNAEVVSG